MNDHLMYRFVTSEGMSDWQQYGKLVRGDTWAGTMARIKKKHEVIEFYFVELPK